MASFRSTISDIDSITRAAECAVCRNEGASRILPTCNHSLCRNCVVTIKSGRTIECPICHQISNIPGGDVDKLATNFTALKVIDEANLARERKKQRKRNILGVRKFSQFPCFIIRVLQVIVD